MLYKQRGKILHTILFSSHDLMLVQITPADYCMLDYYSICVGGWRAYKVEKGLNNLLFNQLNIEQH